MFITSKVGQTDRRTTYAGITRTTAISWRKQKLGYNLVNYNAHAKHARDHFAAIISDYRVT